VAVEAALTGKEWCEATIETAIPGFARDFTPMSDMRASAEYRLRTAQNMLWRYFHAHSGTTISVLEVSP